MVKLTAITLAFIASTVQCAVLKTEDLSLKRTARSPVSNGPVLHTQNWSGLARSATGQNTIFSGASAAADQGLPTAGSAFSLAASGPLATAQDEQSSDSKANQDAEKPSLSTRFGGDYDDQQSVVGGGKFISGGFKESHFSYHSGGGARFGVHDGIAHNGGYGSASSASSSAQSGGVNGYHGFGQGNSAFESNQNQHLQAQKRYQQGNSLNGGFGSTSAASSQSGAVGSNYGAGIGHGYGGSYTESSSHGKNIENQGDIQQSEHQQQSQEFGSANAQALSNGGETQNGQQSGGFGSSSNQQKLNSFENGVKQNSGFGGAHSGFQDSSNQQSESAGLGTSSSSSAQSGAFGENNGAGISNGYGGRYSESNGHGIQQADHQKQSQAFGLANTGVQSNGGAAQNYQQQSSSFRKDLGGHELQSSSGGSQFGQGGFESSQHASGSTQAGGIGSSSFEGQSALKGALDLASQGLQASGQPGCSTCGKSSLALSNAKSHSGSAVALSISG